MTEKPRRSETKIDENSMPVSEEQPSEGDQSPESLQHFEGLREHNDGSVSLHSSTSLFNILGCRSYPITNLSSKMEGSRDRLVNDAWEQRSLEQLLNLPVFQSLSRSSPLN
jgi:hypothetical protein